MSARATSCRIIRDVGQRSSCPRSWNFQMGLFSKIFGSKQSAERGGAGDVAPVPASWSFIEGLFAELYPGQTPKHAAPPVAPQHDLRLGRASVEGTHLYDAGQAWHYVTLGLTELYDQSDASFGPNGIRCELSMRVAKRESAEPPLWPVAFLEKSRPTSARARSWRRRSPSEPARSLARPPTPGWRERWRCSIPRSSRGPVPSGRWG